MTIDLQDICPEDIDRMQQESEPLTCIHCGKVIEDWFEDDAIFDRNGDVSCKICDDRHEEGRENG